MKGLNNISWKRPCPDYLDVTASMIQFGRAYNGAVDLIVGKGESKGKLYSVSIPSSGAPSGICIFCDRSQ